MRAGRTKSAEEGEVSGCPRDLTYMGTSQVTPCPLVVAHTHLQGKDVGEELVRHL